MFITLKDFLIMLYYLHLVNQKIIIIIVFLADHK